MHYEESLIPDILSRHMNTYRYSINQIADHFIITFITHRGKYPKDTEEHSTKHRFKKLNILTVNETVLKTK